MLIARKPKLCIVYTRLGIHVPDGFFVLEACVSSPVRRSPFIYSRQTGELNQLASSPQFAKRIGKLANCIAAAVSCVFIASSSPFDSVRRSIFRFTHAAANWNQRRMHVMEAGYHRARQNTPLSAKVRSLITRGIAQKRRTARFGVLQVGR